MWILKGVLLGAWLFIFGTIAMVLYVAVFRRLPGWTIIGGTWLFIFGIIAFLYFAIRKLGGGMIEDPTVFASRTIQNPLWWVALAACIVLGCALVRSWPGKGYSPGFWVALLVTDLIPLGLLGLFLVAVARLKEAIK